MPTPAVLALRDREAFVVPMNRYATCQCQEFAPPLPPGLGPPSSKAGTSSDPRTRPSGAGRSAPRPLPMLPALQAHIRY